MILYMFQCHSPKSSHPRPLPQSKRLFYTSMSLLLSRIQGYRYFKKNNTRKKKEAKESPLGRETASSKSMNIFQFPRCFQTALQNNSTNKTTSSSFLDPQRFSQIPAHRRHSENFYQMTRSRQKFKRIIWTTAFLPEGEYLTTLAITECFSSSTAW